MIELKILPKFYNDILYKDKRFEVRDTTDRTFRLGDLVLLREYYNGGIYWSRMYHKNYIYLKRP